MAAVSVWSSLPRTIAQAPRRPAVPQGVAGAGRGPIAQGWAEVISVTDKWIVLQNERGQQFPLAFDSVGVFLVRWPADLSRISPDAMVEATGVDNGSRQITTDHVDVYEGAARNMVTPTVTSINGAGMVVRPIDYLFDAPVYGEPFPGVAPPIQGGVQVQAPQIHVVGPLAGLNPIRVATVGGNAVGVFPGPNGMDVTQVTAGSHTFVRCGDLIFYVASAVLPKTLAVSQLVVYKDIPLSRFVP
jgi:hypothetical protein